MLEDLVLGIEFGSTRIKGVLINDKNDVVFSANYEWENKLNDGFWSYDKDEIIKGLKSTFKGLKEKAENETGEILKTVKAIGISAMMHGYIALDENDNLLVPFRTWRNTRQEKASEELSKLFDFNIPQRWSVAHLYQAILNNEPHVKKIKYLTTLSGYIHYLLTGNKVLGLDDASGMFPIDIKTQDFNSVYLEKFNALIKEKGLQFRVEEILPTPLCAGSFAGALTEKGVELIDDSKTLDCGINFCPPEGDAGTGMICTNSIKEKYGNISAGTSIFAMVTIDKSLSKFYPEIDIVTTPDGKEVAMVHCNNCSADIDAYIKLFKQVSKTLGYNVSYDSLYNKLFAKALEADVNTGNIVSVNYLSGEHITKFDKGVPMMIRQAESNFNVENFMRSLLNSALSTIGIGMNILKDEGIVISKMYGHGGFFKVKDVGQIVTSCALNAPITLMATAGEGGAFGIAILAKYMLYKEKYSLSEFLDKFVFSGKDEYTVVASDKDKENFNKYLENYKKLLLCEDVAIKNF